MPGAIAGGGGGGALGIVAHTVILEGVISADGVAARGNAGGGAGGSVVIVTNQLSGVSGVVSACGGATQSGASGGGGAGGRIAVSYYSKDFNGSLAAHGGRNGRYSHGESHQPVSTDNVFTRVQTMGQIQFDNKN